MNGSDTLQNRHGVLDTLTCKNQTSSSCPAPDVSRPHDDATTSECSARDTKTQWTGECRWRSPTTVWGSCLHTTPPARRWKALSRWSPFNKWPMASFMSCAKVRWAQMHSKNLFWRVGSEGAWSKDLGQSVRSDLRQGSAGTRRNTSSGETLNWERCVSLLRLI